MNLYPPIVESSLPAFSAREGCNFYYKISDFNSEEDIRNVQISIVYQDSGRNALNTSLYPNEIIFANRPKGEKYITIPSTALEEGWKEGKAYKIQMRFGNSVLPSENPPAAWISEQITAGNFSEWSTICLVKVTGSIGLKIMGFEENATNYVNTQVYNFQGQYNNSDKSEPELQYKFLLYSADEKLIEESDWIYSTKSKTDEYVFKNILKDNTNYYVEYKIVTKNGYTKSINYLFEVVTDALAGMEATITPTLNEEEGYIEINISGEEYIGNFVLLRTDSRSNYTLWDDYKFYVLEGKPIQIKEKDFLIENGIIYKYGIQRINKNGLRGTVTVSNPILCNFNYAYLYADGIQLKLQLDTLISNFKVTKMRSKQDTIGNKYPVFMENGTISYKAFPLNGLISIVEDEAELFIKKDRLYHEDENADVLVDYARLYEKVDNTNEAYFIEKQFREKVEEWLNNGKPKLFKSLTEGNIIVNLLDVSLTPKEELYRLLYDFSCNAYEIAENSFETYSNLHLHKPGKFEPVDSATWYEIGQIKGPLRGIYSIDKATGIISANDIPEDLEYPYTNIRAEIEKQRNIINEDDEYRQVVDKVLAIYIEANPGTRFYLKSGTNPLQQMTVGLGEIYTLNTTDEVDITELYFHYDQDSDVIINYICQMRIEENEAKTLKSSKVTKFWGQLHGYFNPNIVLYGNEKEQIKDNIYAFVKGNDIYFSLNIGEIILNKVINEDIVNIAENENYNFIDIPYLYIECDEGNVIEVNGEDIYIGPTSTYEVRDTVSIQSLKFKQPTYALVNYICRLQKEVYNE